MRAALQIDWEAIRNDFTYGVKNEAGALVFPGCEELARQHGITGQTIRRKCNKGNWRDLREVLKLEAAAKADAEFRDKMAGELTKVDMLAFTVAVKGIEKVQKGLDEIEDNDARSINCLAVAARVFQDIAHRAAGKVKKDFAAILKIERRTNVQDDKATIQEVVRTVLEFATDEPKLDSIIAALDRVEEGGL